jgi:hypothetical protein
MQDGPRRRRTWQDLFAASFDVLLYDLTSTYFESDPPSDEEDKRRFGYSRDKRGDCVQVVIALVVTPQGFPLAYEVLPGNTSDKTTLRSFLQKIEAHYGNAQRIWVMDRGIPTEEVLEEMRSADPPVFYLVGTPKGRLTKMEKALIELPWRSVRDGVDVKLLEQEQELYVLTKSRDRVHKERAMRRRQLKWLWARLAQLSTMKLKREELLMKLGAARAKAPAAWRLIDVDVPASGATFSYALDRNKLRQVRRREGRYLLRTNLCGQEPAELWQFYIQLTEISRPPSGRSRTISDCVRFIIGSNSASKPISSSPSWLIACMSPCGQGSSRWPVGSRRGPCSTSSPPFRCSTFTSRLRMAAR